MERMTRRSQPPDHNNLLPKRIDPKLTNSERHQQQEDWLAAAEKRQKASRVPKSKKRKASSQKGQPLRGPNTKRQMQWRAQQNKTPAGPAAGAFEGKMEVRMGPNRAEWREQTSAKVEVNEMFFGQVANLAQRQ